MKKNIKKCFALFLAVVMTLTMAVSVFAAVTPLNGDKTVTVNGTNGATYKFYKVADVAVNGDAYKYTIVAPFSYDSTITPKYLASVTEATDLQNLAKRLGDLVGDNVATKTLNYDADHTSVPLEPGYYLMVADPTGTKLTAANSLFTVLTDNVTITPKTSDVTMTKKIVDDYNGTNPRDTSTANVGDDIVYRIETTVPSYGAGVTDVKYWITDNPSAGLTIDHATTNIVVKDNGAVVDPSNYTLVWNADTDGGFTLKFTSEWVLANGNKTIDTYFTAKLNDDAVIGNADNNKLPDYDGTNLPNPDKSYNKGNPNGAKLEYSNNFTTGGGSETIKDEVTTFTFKLKVKKVGADALEVGLKDAEFTVYTDSDCKNVYTNGKFNGILKTGADGTVTAEGFKDGTYYIKETKAPEDYNLYEGKIIVVITANRDATSNEYDGKYKYTITMDNETTEEAIDKADKVVVVIDQKGLTLPGTGGIGTTLFTFGGIALILVACVMFIVYTRKQKKQS